MTRVYSLREELLNVRFSLIADFSQLQELTLPCTIRIWRAVGVQKDTFLFSDYSRFQLQAEHLQKPS